MASEQQAKEKDDKPEVEGYSLDASAAPPPAAEPAKPVESSDITTPALETTLTSDKASSPPLQPSNADAEATPAQPAEAVAAPTAPAPPLVAPIPVAPEQPLDPDISELHAMFPDIPTEILSEVLAGHRGDKEAAINTLLSMSDPNFKPSQQETDEEYARSLAQEDQGGQYSHLAYQPRTRNGGGRRRAQPPPPEDGRDEMDKIADQLDKFAAHGKEQFGKFAEEGKKTFNFLLSKGRGFIKDLEKPKEPIPVESTGGISPAQMLSGRAPSSSQPTPPVQTAAIPQRTPEPKSSETPPTVKEGGPPNLDESKIEEPVKRNLIIKQRRDSDDDEEFQRNPFDDYDD
ncbi:hypothetical protein BT69DRAFT_1346973 [Atractiella rhizophila]|nr:hypothetical protein BT69DRAFT_1346973 [Atractiella rhizophila]